MEMDAASVAALDVNENDPLAFFWDLENCQIPASKCAMRVVQSLRAKFQKMGSEQEFTVVCDVTKELPAVVDNLNAAQVTVLHVSSSSKNAADEKLRSCLRKFANVQRAPATVVLISGDVNFSPELHELRYRCRFTVIVLHSAHVNDSLLAYATVHFSFQQFLDDVPEQQSVKNLNAPSACVVRVHNLPLHVPVDRVRERLKRLSDNCGGRVLTVDVGHHSGCTQSALIRFPNATASQRSIKRLTGEDVFGHRITASNERNKHYNQSAARNNQVANQRALRCKRAVSDHFFPFGTAANANKRASNVSACKGDRQLSSSPFSSPNSADRSDEAELSDDEMDFDEADNDVAGSSTQHTQPRTATHWPVNTGLQANKGTCSPANTETSAVSDRAQLPYTDHHAHTSLFMSGTGRSAMDVYEKSEPARSGIATSAIQPVPSTDTISLAVQWGIAVVPPPDFYGHNSRAETSADCNKQSHIQSMTSSAVVAVTKDSEVCLAVFGVAQQDVHQLNELLRPVPNITVQSCVHGTTHYTLIYFTHVQHALECSRLSAESLPQAHVLLCCHPSPELVTQCHTQLPLPGTMLRYFATAVLRASPSLLMLMDDFVMQLQQAVTNELHLQSTVLHKYNMPCSAVSADLYERVHRAHVHDCMADILHTTSVNSVQYVRLTRCDDGAMPPLGVAGGGRPFTGPHPQNTANVQHKPVTNEKAASQAVPSAYTTDTRNMLPAFVRQSVPVPSHMDNKQQANGLHTGNTYSPARDKTPVNKYRNKSKHRSRSQHYSRQQQYEQPHTNIHSVDLTRFEPSQLLLAVLVAQPSLSLMVSDIERLFQLYYGQSAIRLYEGVTSLNEMLTNCEQLIMSEDGQVVRLTPQRNHHVRSQQIAYLFLRRPDSQLLERDFKQQFEEAFDCACDPAVLSEAFPEMLERLMSGQVGCKPDVIRLHPLQQFALRARQVLIGGGSANAMTVRDFELAYKRRWKQNICPADYDHNSVEDVIRACSHVIYIKGRTSSAQSLIRINRNFMAVLKPSKPDIIIPYYSGVCFISTAPALQHAVGFLRDTSRSRTASTAHSRGRAVPQVAGNAAGNADAAANGDGGRHRCASSNEVVEPVAANHMRRDRRSQSIVPHEHEQHDTSIKKEPSNQSLAAVSASYINTDQSETGTATASVTNQRALYAPIGPVLLRPMDISAHARMQPISSQYGAVSDQSSTQSTVVERESRSRLHNRGRAPRLAAKFGAMNL